MNGLNSFAKIFKIMTNKWFLLFAILSNQLKLFTNN